MPLLYVFVLYIVGLTTCDQRDAAAATPPHVAFFITNNARTLRLSSSSPTGAAVLSKVIACSGTFSQTSSSPQPFPQDALG